jgi:hypothetical protein
MKLQSSTFTIGLIFVIWLGLILGCSDTEDTESGEGGGLPPGKYQCATTVATYSHTGGSGGASYPVYNFTPQVRSSIVILKNGTYQLDEGATPSKYSYDPATGKVEWNGDEHGMTADSSFDSENGIIYVQMGNEKWDCKPQDGN